jgi:LacI family transcriptional regulator
LKTKKTSSGRRQHEHVTVNDVAKRAGVSPMTVSRVVNGSDNVRTSTREAVFRAIEELGYTPNKAARSLASANPVKIGYVYTDKNNSFFSAMMRGLLDRSHHADTHILIEECNEGPDSLRVITGLIDEGIDGIMMGPPLCDSVPALELLEKHRIPSVTVGSRHFMEFVSEVRVDDHEAAKELTRFILSLGHRRIAFIIGNHYQSASWMRLDGFTEAMAEAGIDPDKNLIRQGNFSYRSGKLETEKLLALADPPTAIINSNDDMAAGSIAAAQRMNLIVPDDITICGFDDTMLATAVEPAITTIRQPIVEMAHDAIRFLEKSIRSIRYESTYRGFRAVLPHELIERESHAPPPGS